MAPHAFHGGLFADRALLKQEPVDSQAGSCLALGAGQAGTVAIQQDQRALGAGPRRSRDWPPETPDHKTVAELSRPANRKAPDCCAKDANLA